ncbi:MAG: nucleotidyl transferase AbiEii/AbiGii toxin family protein [Chloroflexi bacterium]|nr:nucleotidyl transferase AbiEii/AbiGii toxin family protein [Chloroflexota bacterium]
MKLHLDTPAFQTVLLTQAERSGIRAEVLEKDYYVTLMLSELAEKQVLIPAYFKGGTALYKALGSVRRFSEDIDLTVSVEDCPSQSQAQKRLEAVTKKYSCLSRKIDDPGNDDKKYSITTIYDYVSVVEVTTSDTLQRYGRVKIEATSFTISEPHELLYISPLIFDLADEAEKETLIKSFGVNRLGVETIKLERIFIDKVFAAEFYYLRKEYSDASKHLYDIVVLSQNEKIQRLLTNPENSEYLINLKRKEETIRKGSGLGRKPINEFSYFSIGLDNKAFQEKYEFMQDIYVFEIKNKITFQELRHGIIELHKSFRNY